MAKYNAINAFLKNKDGEWISPYTADTLKKNQITNCLLEIPQRIKYTLENSTLTIKAGSVLIVPYGVEDLTAQYPVDSTFINDNFKVYDTQFEDSKFFVWVELVNDLVVTTNLTNANRYIMYNFNVDDVNSMNSAVVSNGSSGETVPTNNGLWYDTANNFVYYYYATTQEKKMCSLPLGVFTTSTTAIENIKHIFNGFGYIGSTIWMDKGVKGLIPNGRNTDGSLNNIEFNSSFSTFLKDYGSTANTNMFFVGYNLETSKSYLSYYQDRYHYWVKDMEEFNRLLNSLGSVGLVAYVESENYNIISDLTISKIITQVLAIDFNADYSVAHYEHIKQPIRVADYSQVDGQWIAKEFAIASTTNYPLSSDITYDLSDELPDDGHSYELLLSTRATTGATSGDVCFVSVKTDKMPTVYIVGTGTRANATVSNVSSAILIVGTKRQLTVVADDRCENGTFQLYVRGYRRLGNNV